jgi:hypothetical protein
MMWDGQHEHPPSDDTDIEANLCVLALLASRVFRSGRRPPVEEIGRVYVADLHHSEHHLEPHLRTGGGWRRW